MGTDGGRSSPAVNKYGWGKSAAVEDWLFAEGYCFDFFQAVRLLEMIHSNGPTAPGERLVSPGQGADPTKEIVHFRSAVKLLVKHRPKRSMTTPLSVAEPVDL